MKNELVGSATQQELRGWGSQWNEQGTGGLSPQSPSLNSNPGENMHACLLRDLLRSYFVMTPQQFS